MDIGCCNHRLESTNSIVFNGPGVAKAMVLAQGLVGRYSASSQMVDRLAQFVKIYIDPDQKKVMQDVATRWWSTCSMLARLLELEWEIDKHEEEDQLSSMLAPVDWTVLALILPILEPFMHTQASLKGRKYVTGSLAVPFVYDLRMNLDAAIAELQRLPYSKNADTNKARYAVMPCIMALRKDFVNRWEDGSDILTYTEGIGRQSRGFKPVQVLATALNPRTKMLYGVEDEDTPGVWKYVQEEAVKIVLENRQEGNSRVSHRSRHRQRRPPRALVEVAPRASVRGGSFIKVSQATGGATGRLGGATDSSTTSLLVNTVRLEVESFQASAGLKTYEARKDGDEPQSVGLVAGDERRPPAFGQPCPLCARYRGHASGIRAPVLLRREHCDDKSQCLVPRERGTACPPLFMGEGGGAGSGERCSGWA